MHTHICLWSKVRTLGENTYTKWLDNEQGWTVVTPFSRQILHAVFLSCFSNVVTQRLMYTALLTICIEDVSNRTPVTVIKTHTHTDEPRLRKERGVCVCAQFWHFLSFSLTPSVVGFHSKTTFTDSPINRLQPTTNSHPLTNTHACTSPLCPFSIPHSFFPPKHTLSFCHFQKGTLNGSLSLLSS